jgi:hypothetical protein
VVSNEEYKTIITPDPGGESEFSFSFGFNLNTDIQVEHWVSGEKTTLYYAEGDFTVYSADTSSGGTVTTKESYSTGTIVIYRKPDYKQYIQFLKSMPNRRQVEEIGFDRITMMARYLKARAVRAIRRNKIDSSDMSMPALGDRAGGNIGFDTDGEIEAITTLREITPSTLGGNLLDAANAAEAQDDIGIHNDWDAMLDAGAIDAVNTVLFPADALPIDDSNGYSEETTQGGVNDELIAPFREYGQARDTISAGEPVGFDNEFYAPVNIGVGDSQLADLGAAAASYFDYADIHISMTSGRRMVYIAWYDSNAENYYISYAQITGPESITGFTTETVAASTSSAQPRVIDLDYGSRPIAVLYKDSSNNWRVKFYSSSLSASAGGNIALEETTDIPSGITHVSMVKVSHDGQYFALVWHDPSSNEIDCVVFDSSLTDQTGVTNMGTVSLTYDLSPAGYPLVNRGDHYYFWSIAGQVDIFDFNIAGTVSSVSSYWSVDDITTEDQGPDRVNSKGGVLCAKPVGGNAECNGLRVYRYNTDSDVIAEIFHLDDSLLLDSSGGLISRELVAISPSTFEWVYLFSIKNDRFTPIAQFNIVDDYLTSRTAVPTSACADNDLLAWCTYDGNIVYFNFVDFLEYKGVALEDISAGGFGSPAESGIIQKKGLASGLSGLIPGMDYGYDYESSAIEELPCAGKFIGVALSETELYLT